MKTYKIITDQGGPAIIVKADDFDFIGCLIKFYTRGKGKAAEVQETVYLQNVDHLVGISVD